MTKTGRQIDSQTDRRTDKGRIGFESVCIGPPRLSPKRKLSDGQGQTGTDRQTDRRTDRQTDKQTDRQANAGLGL